MGRKGKKEGERGSLWQVGGTRLLEIELPILTLVWAALGAVVGFLRGKITERLSLGAET